MAAAAAVLAEETAAVRTEATAGTDAAAESAESDEAAVHARVWAATHADVAFLPGKGRLGRLSLATPSEQAAALELVFARAREAVARRDKAAVKAEAKVKVLTAGYQDRAAKTRDAVRAAGGRLTAAATTLATFKLLQQREAEAIPARIARLEAEVVAQTARGGELQRRYQALLDRRAAALAPAVAN
jgi:pre-mRNA-splicing factor CDC5/CEF1